MAQAPRSSYGDGEGDNQSFIGAAAAAAATSSNTTNINNTNNTNNGQSSNPCSININKSSSSKSKSKSKSNSSSQSRSSIHTNACIHYIVSATYDGCIKVFENRKWRWINGTKRKNKFPTNELRMHSRRLDGFIGGACNNKWKSVDFIIQRFFITVLGGRVLLTMYFYLLHIRYFYLLLILATFICYLVRTSYFYLLLNVFLLLGWFLPTSLSLSIFLN